MVVQLSGDHFVGSLGNQLAYFGRNFTEFCVRLGGAFLQNSKGANNRGSPNKPVAPDGKVLDGSLSLRPPIARGFDLNCTHRIGFDANIHSTMVSG